jgi:hypothetical protein
MESRDKYRKFGDFDQSVCRGDELKTAFLRARRGERRARPLEPVRGDIAIGFWYNDMVQSP